MTLILKVSININKCQTMTPKVVLYCSILGHTAYNTLIHLLLYVQKKKDSYLYYIRN